MKLASTLEPTHHAKSPDSQRTSADPLKAADPLTPGVKPFLLRAVKDLKVLQKLRLCGLLCVAAGLLPTLVLLYRLHPADPTGLEKGVLTSLVCVTVVVQTLGLMLTLLIGRQILMDISGSLHRLGGIVRALSNRENGTVVEIADKGDEISALAGALQQMIEDAKLDRQKLIQGNVALVLSNERLAQTNMELEAANSKVRQLAEQAGAANLAKRDFLAVMSHEIRTPVNGIIGMTELAMKTSLSGSQRDYLETVNSSAQCLLELLNDILDFSKIEAGKLELEVIDFSLRETLESAAATYAERYHTKGIELLVDVRPEVPDALVGDPYRLRQVVLNLISNALRFTPQGEVIIRAEISQINEVETLLRFTVSDTGCGIPAEKREAIFDAFSQADSSTTRRFGGTGLGLAICKQLVQLMDGWISVQSSPVGGGSEFQFRARFGVGATLTQPEKYTLSGRRALVLESHEKSASLLANALGAVGMTVETVANVNTALLHIETTRRCGEEFDFIIADTLHAASGGLELTRRLPEFQLTDPRLILLHSAARRDDFPAKTHAVAEISKPIRIRKLITAMEAALLPKSADAPCDAAPAATPTAPHGRQLRVLVAEDNATNQRIVRTHLESWGHIVVTADDGVEAVTKFGAHSFDLVFMDLQMPRMDGIAATATIRQREKSGDHVPIIALTANVLKGVREECIASGMDGYLGKPAREHELLACIENAVPGLRPIAHTQKLPLPPTPSSIAKASLAAAQFPFDVAELLSSVNGRREVLSQLLQDSRDEDLPDLITQLSAAVAAKNCDSVRRAAHAIKGVVGVFQAPTALAAAKRLEDSARAKQPENFSAQSAELLRAVFDLLTSLERFLAGPASQAA